MDKLQIVGIMMNYSIQGAGIIGYLCRKQSKIISLIYTHQKNLIKS